MRDEERRGTGEETARRRGRGGARTKSSRRRPESSAGTGQPPPFPDNRALKRMNATHPSRRMCYTSSSPWREAIPQTSRYRPSLWRGSAAFSQDPRDSSRPPRSAGTPAGGLFDHRPQCEVGPDLRHSPAAQRIAVNAVGLLPRQPAGPPPPPPDLGVPRGRWDAGCLNHPRRRSLVSEPGCLEGSRANQDFHTPAPILRHVNSGGLRQTLDSRKRDSAPGVWGPETNHGLLTR